MGRAALRRRLVQAGRAERRTDFPAVGDGDGGRAGSRSTASSCGTCWRRRCFADLARREPLRAERVLFAVQDREIRIVATDGHRLALAIAAAGERGGGGLRHRAAQGRAGDRADRRDSGEDVRSAISDNQFMLRMPNVLLMARLIEGTFPNYEQVVPKAHPHRIAVARDALTAALRRVSVLSEERTEPVKFTLSPGLLKLDRLPARISARPRSRSRCRTRERR